MPEIAYTVAATFPDHETASEYIAWLQGGHIAEVVAHGAASGLIVRIEEPSEPIQVEARYVFPTRESYRSYIELHSPRLRAEGAKRFGGRPGVRFERRTGVVV